MTAYGVVVENRNIFDPVKDRLIHPLAAPMTIRQWLASRSIIDFDQPTYCLHNGIPVLRAAWDATLIGRGDICNFITLPAGGGGGEGGKSPLKIVLQVAVLVAASWAAAALGPYVGMALFTEGVGATWATSLAIGQAIVGGAVTIGGSLLLSAALPAPRPSTPGVNYGGIASTPAASATYSLESQGNKARLGQPIPVIYGRHRVYPDLAANPYQEFVDNEQFLHQLMVIGHGEFDVEDIYIEDTPISSFTEVETELVTPGNSVTLIDPSVVTAVEVAGQKLIGPSDVAEGDDGYIGPFVVNPPETTATHIGIDIIFPRGLYYANNSGGIDSKTVTWVVEVREIDDDGDPVEDAEWTEIGDESHTAASNTPIRLSYKYAVTGDRFEARAKRTNNEDATSRDGHEARWGQCRAYLDETPDFSGLTVLAVKAQATDNLSQRSSRLVNLIVTRKLPIWSAEGGWTSPVATRSIAWAAADAARSTYGGELPDGKLDLDALAALDTVWSGRGDYFDAVFDSVVTCWEGLTRILRPGRAVPIQQGGIIRTIRDAPATLQTAMFGPNNMIRGSFEIAWILPGEDTADAVTVEYWSDKTWKTAEVTVMLDDSAGDEPRRITLFGVTGKSHSEREGLKVAADNRYRRKFIKFRTEMDGLIPTYLDQVSVTHPMPEWGQGGEVTDWTASDIAGGTPYENAVLTLTEPPVFTEGETHYIGLRRRDGSMAGPFEVVAVEGEGFKIALVDDLDMTPDIAGCRERTHFTFGPGENYTQAARVLAIRPRNGQVEILCVNEDSRAHPN